MNAPPPQHPLTDPGPAPGDAPARRRLAVGAMLGVGLLFWLAFYGPREMTRWHLAAAQNAWTDGQYEEVVAAANRGLAWDEESPSLLAIRSQARLELQDVEGALQDLNAMIELAAVDGETTEADMRPLASRAQVLQRLDRFQEAVDDWDDIVAFRAEQFTLRDDSESRYVLYALALNNRAYTKALGRIDIAGALEDIDQSIEVRGREDDPVLIDTLGYLLFLNNQNEEALYYLKSAVALSKIQDESRRRDILDQMQQATDQRPYEAELKRLDEQHSVILHHRGEAYQVVGEEEQAEADFSKAKELGYDPEAGVW